MHKLLLKNLFISVLLACTLTLCQKQAKTHILSGQAFEDVLLKAEKEQKYLCVVLVDSAQRNGNGYS
jgi:hypothetical protein